MQVLATHPQAAPSSTLPLIRPLLSPLRPPASRAQQQRQRGGSLVGIASQGTLSASRCRPPPPEAPPLLLLTGRSRCPSASLRSRASP